jgi:hypothetical protein
MQLLQPTHKAGSTKTMPSLARFCMAPEGQADTHQGFSQWKQGMKMNAAFGRPSTIRGGIGTTWQGAGPTARDLLTLHVTWQDWQPMQF